MRIAKGKRICIICEGYEEEDYINALISKSLFSKSYNITVVNAKSINNIFSRYQDKYQSDSYTLVLVFCDTDRAPYEAYNNVKEKINKYHNCKVADDIVIFGNPCTMQIILSHFAKVELHSQNKAKNAKYIEKYTSIKDYKASNEQRKELFSLIDKANYKTMKANLKAISTNDLVVPSTNFLKHANNLEKDDFTWINKINKKI